MTTTNPYDAASDTLHLLLEEWRNNPRRKGAASDVRRILTRYELERERHGDIRLDEIRHPNGGTGGSGGISPVEDVRGGNEEPVTDSVADAGRHLVVKDMAALAGTAIGIYALCAVVWGLVG